MDTSQTRITVTQISDLCHSQVARIGLDMPKMARYMIHETRRYLVKAIGNLGNPEESDEIQRDQEKSKEIQRNPERSREIQRNPAKSREIQTEETQEILRNPGRSTEIR